MHGCSSVALNYGRWCTWINAICKTHWNPNEQIKRLKLCWFSVNMQWSLYTGARSFWWYIVADLYLTRIRLSVGEISEPCLGICTYKIPLIVDRHIGGTTILSNLKAVYTFNPPLFCTSLGHIMHRIDGYGISCVIYLSVFCWCQTPEGVVSPHRAITRVQPIYSIDRHRFQGR